MYPLQRYTNVSNNITITVNRICYNCPYKSPGFKKFCNVVENFCYLSRMSWKVAKKKYRRHCLTFCRSYRICIHQCTFFPRTLRPRCDFLVCVCFFLCSKLSYCSGFLSRYTLHTTYSSPEQEKFNLTQNCHQPGLAKIQIFEKIID